MHGPLSCARAVQESQRSPAIDAAGTFGAAILNKEVQWFAVTDHPSARSLEEA
jgi:hypothetical protein